MTGNYAAEVLQELEQKHSNQEQKRAIGQISKEVNKFLKFDAGELTEQMNKAFEGKKDELDFDKVYNDLKKEEKLK